MITIKHNCPICNGRYRPRLKKAETKKFLEYCRGKGFIQDQLPNLNPVEREFLKSGYCPTCQTMLFGNGETIRVRKA